MSHFESMIHFGNPCVIYSIFSPIRHNKEWIPNYIVVDLVFNSVKMLPRKGG